MSDKKIIRLSSNPEDLVKYPDELTTEMFESALPVQHSYEYYADEELGLYVGVWDTTDMVEAAGAYVCDEFMWLIEGSASIKNNRTGEMETVQAGQAFIIPKGYDCQWHQQGYLRKYYVISEHPEEDIPAKPAYEGIVIPDINTTQTVSTDNPFFIESDTESKSFQCYIDGTGKFRSGIWRSSAFNSMARPALNNQFFYVEAGSITFVDEDNQQHHFNQGEALFIPEGVVYSAQSNVDVQLIYAILQSKR